MDESTLEYYFTDKSILVGDVTKKAFDMLKVVSI
jgi:hypothetical protein